MKLSDVLGSAEPPTEKDLMVLSYRGLRKGVGLLGLALPVVLLIGYLTHFIAGHTMPTSMSAFYYTHLGPYFVGTLCAQGVFLFSYRYSQADNRLSNLAAAAITLVALCPMEHGNPPTIWNRLHLASATVFFLTVAFFSAFLFTRKPGQVHWWDSWAAARWVVRTNEDRRDLLYRLCAIVIVLALVAAVLFQSGTKPNLFWCETVAVLAFSFSWLVKAQMKWLWLAPIFGDP